MPRSGGTFTAPSNSWNPAVEGTTVDETDWNSTLQDIEDALTESVYTGGLGATDNRLVRTDGTDTKKVQGTGITVDDTDNVTGVTSITVGNTGLVVGSSTPFSDSTGTLTLQNVDALDATTEATIEAAIDTLANLTSIQGRTVTLADAGANAIFGWDDTAGAYENLSAAEATAVLNAFVGDSGAGGTKGLVPAPGVGDSGKVLMGDGTWGAAGTGDLVSTNNLSDVANAGTARTNLGFTAAGSAMGTAASATAQTALLDAFTGDSGSGGVKGLVPAPAAGDAAASKFLKADGTWTAPAGAGTVTSISPGSGITSDVTAAAPGSAITGSGTLSAARLVNAQTGTTYTVLDGDRGKLVTLSNVSAVAVTLPQAGTSSAFSSGWFAWFRNLNTGAVTITPTTSTIDGSASVVLNRGDAVLIVSDGTNYQTGGIQRATFSRMAVYTSNDTFTPPAGCYWVDVEVWGGGGGSGGTDASNRGAGGGGGGYGRQIVPVVPGSGVTVTVGAAGAAGTATPGAGGNGGTSSFGAYSATGGSGSAAATGVIGGGAGGTSSMTFNVTGSAGQANNYVSGATAAGAGGGAFGAGQAFPNAAAIAPGGGGYGNASTSSAGLAGGAGRVVVWY